MIIMVSISVSDTETNRAQDFPQIALYIFAVCLSPNGTHESIKYKREAYLNTSDGLQT